MQERSLSRYVALVLIAVLMPFLVYGQENLHRYSRELMGTQFNILIYGKKGDADIYSNQAFDEIKRIENIFSTYIPTSEVSQINAGEGWQKVSSEFAQIIASSEILNKHSQGAFDIKIGKVIDLWKVAIKEEKMPNPKSIKKLKRKKYWINFKETQNGYWVKLSKNTELDFGGIAKGYAVDKAFELLIKHKMISCLIDGGGDIRMGISPPKSEGWKIEIYNEKGEIHLLENCAIASSGHDYQFMKIEDHIYTHIIDPKTFSAMKVKRGVTVMTDSCQLADALATAMYINPKDHELRDHFIFKARIKENGQFLNKDF